jgi:hypothetical protein
MKNYLYKLLIVFSSICSYGCGTDKINTENNINGNWSTLIDSVYNEFSFRGDTLERFNLEWDLLPPATYKVINDSLTTKSTNGSSTIIKYKLTFIDSDNAVLENLNTKLVLKKIPDDEYTIDDLINQGLFNYGFDDLAQDSLISNFHNYIFAVREIRHKIENDILKKDTLIKYWNSQILNDDKDKEYYKFLIKEINENLP